MVIRINYTIKNTSNVTGRLYKAWCILTMWEKFFFVKIKAYLVESYDDKVIISIMKPCINEHLLQCTVWLWSHRYGYLLLIMICNNGNAKSEKYVLFLWFGNPLFSAINALDLYEILFTEKEKVVKKKLLCKSYAIDYHSKFWFCKLWFC